MDVQTVEIIRALRQKVHKSVLSLESAGLTEFVREGEKATLQATALAGKGVDRAAAAKAKEGAEWAAKSKAAHAAADTAKKAELAKISAGPAKPAPSAKEAEATAARAATRTSNLARIKKALNQSLDTIDLPVLIEEMESLLADPELAVADRIELRGMLKGLAGEILETYEVSEDDKAYLDRLVLGEAKKNTLPQQGAAPTAAAPERALAAPAAPNNMGLQKTAQPQNVVSPGTDYRAVRTGLTKTAKSTTAANLNQLNISTQVLGLDRIKDKPTITRLQKVLAKTEAALSPAGQAAFKKTNAAYEMTNQLADEEATAKEGGHAVNISASRAKHAKAAVSHEAAAMAHGALGGEQHTAMQAKHMAQMQHHERQA